MLGNLIFNKTYKNICHGEFHIIEDKSNMETGAIDIDSTPHDYQQTF